MPALSRLKYTRADVRCALPDDYGDIIDELIHSDSAYDEDKELYYTNTIDNIIELDQSDAVIGRDERADSAACNRRLLLSAIFLTAVRAQI